METKSIIEAMLRSPEKVFFPWLERGQVYKLSLKNKPLVVMYYHTEAICPKCGKVNFLPKGVVADSHTCLCKNVLQELEAIDPDYITISREAWKQIKMVRKFRLVKVKDEAAIATHRLQSHSVITAKLAELKEIELRERVAAKMAAKGKKYVDPKVYEPLDYNFGFTLPEPDPVTRVEEPTPEEDEGFTPTEEQVLEKAMNPALMFATGGLSGTLTLGGVMARRWWNNRKGE